MTATVATVASGNGTANFTVSVPAGTTNGDLLIAVNASDWSTLASEDVPAGFTALTTSRYDGGSNKVHIALGYRIASSEPASYTFAGGGGSDSVGAILRITGHDGTPVIAQVAPSALTAGSGSVNAPSITPNASDDLLLCFACTDGANGGGTLTWTPPSGMTEEVDRQSTTFTSLTVASLQSPSTPSGTKTFTASAAHDAGGTCTISIKSSGTSPTTLTDGSVGQARLSNSANTVAIGVALSDAATPVRSAGTVDVLTVGVALVDQSAAAVRAGNVFGEAAVNSLALADPAAGGIRGAGTSDALAIGVVLSDPSIAGGRLGGTAATLTSGIILLDVIGASRASGTADSLAIGIALADPSVGAARAGNVVGETATAALSISDPSVGGARLGATSTSVASGVALVDRAGSIRLAGKTDSVSYALVLADLAGGLRLAGTAGSLVIGGGAEFFVCQDLAGTASPQVYAGAASTLAYGGSRFVVSYGGSAVVESYGGDATNCGR